LHTVCRGKSFEKNSMYQYECVIFVNIISRAFSPCLIVGQLLIWTTVAM
jgi:hypothetical protein